MKGFFGLVVPFFFLLGTSCSFADYKVVDSSDLKFKTGSLIVDDQILDLPAGSRLRLWRLIKTDKEVFDEFYSIAGPWNGTVHGYLSRPLTWTEKLFGRGSEIERSPRTAPGATRGIE